MKFIRTILFSLLALSLIICTGVYIFFEVFDTDQYLPQITKQVSFVLGRPVSIEHVGLGLSFRGITLDAGPLTVADDPNFTAQPFIKVDRVRISLDFRSLILRREIRITDVLLQSPQIHFIRSREGSFNAWNIGQTRPATSSNRPLAIARRALPVGSRTPNFIEPKALGRLEIQDAAISFIDQSQTMPLDIWLTHINATLDDFSLSRPLRLSFNASFYSNGPNVYGGALVSLPGLQAEGNLSKRSFQISGLSLHTDFSHLDIEGLKYISPGMLPDSPILKDIIGVVQLNMGHLEISASGNIEADGDLTLTGGVIKNFNIVKTILSYTLGAFGNTGNLLNGHLKGKLGADDTIIEKAGTKFSFHDKTLFIDDSLIKTNVLELDAKGSIDQGLNTDMQTMLHLNADVSTALVNEMGGLKFLCDDSHRITIGGSLKGIVPHLKYKPDKGFRKKSKKMLMEEGADILGVLLGGEQSSDQEQDPGKKHKNSFKNIIKGFLLHSKA